eukprot:1543025-Prymnesium_polylepis.1
MTCGGEHDGSSLRSASSAVSRSERPVVPCGTSERACPSRSSSRARASSRRSQTKKMALSTSRRGAEWRESSASGAHARWRM